MSINIVNSFISTIFVSIPEQIFIAFMTLFMLGAIETFKTNALKKFSMVLIPAVFTNISDFIRIDGYFALLINTLFIILFAWIVTKKHIARVAISVVASVLLLVISESLFGLPIMNVFHLTSHDFENNSILAFAVSIPCRIIQLSVIYKLNSETIKRTIESWPIVIDMKTSRKRRRSALVFLVILLTSYSLYVKYCAFDGLLQSLDSVGVMAVSLFVFVLPLLPFIDMAFFARKNHEIINEIQNSISYDVNSDLLLILESSQTTGDKQTEAIVSNLINKWKIADE